MAARTPTLTQRHGACKHSEATTYSILDLPLHGLIFQPARRGRVPGVACGDTQPGDAGPPEELRHHLAAGLARPARAKGQS